ncbi:MAG: L-seryl-tRNA(Sec) selenium transferase [Dehalococcoidia bacterium]
MSFETNFSQLPSVDKVLPEPRVEQLSQILPHDRVVAIIRQCLSETRQSMAEGNLPPSFDEIVGQVLGKARDLQRPSLQPVINATGVVLHTNLGRAPLSIDALKAIESVSQDYSNLEFELDTGKRGSRYAHVKQLLCQLSGAEDAMVVNNNASGVLLALSALARRKEVIVSRGEAVEIGGGFRLPEVIRQSGAKLVDVGTTNCTYLTDYEQAITAGTVALLRVHQSNFTVRGHTHSVTLGELAQLGKRYGLPVLEDLGSGCFIDTSRFGLDPEPRVQDTISSGASLAFFSGDKLLGGPQAGIILGRKDLIAKLRKHPLTRAIRIDKLTLAGLAATLNHYLKEEAEQKIPVLRFIATPLSKIDQRANRLVQALGSSAKVTDGESVIGGGSLAGGTLPTRLVAIKLNKGKASQLAQNLRQGNPSIIARVKNDRLFLDLRCVLPEMDDQVIAALQRGIDELSREG